MEEPTFEIAITPEIEIGVYSNFVTVWHTPHEFTLDFSVTQPTQAQEDGGVVVPARIVSRLKISPTLIFDLMRALNDNMGKYEARMGPIRRVGEVDEGGQV